jgi:hypothetical protein
LLDRLANGGLTMGNLVTIQKTLCGEFPDSTYLPVTSLGFHQRFAAAIFLLLYDMLGPHCIQSNPDHICLTFYLHTIVSPPERLTNRLRDTATVRKISHELQERLHRHLRQRYLQELDVLGLQHPDHNPLFFYNKDATVALTAAQDQEDLYEICSEVAAKTESVLTLMRQEIRVKLAVELSTHQPLPPLPTALHALPVAHFHKVTARATPCDPRRDTFFPPWSAIPQTQPAEQSTDHCVSCNKPAPRANLSTDQRGDALCQTCCQMRERYPYCLSCHVYVPADADACPYCQAESPPQLRTGFPNPQVIHSRREGAAGHRVAYVLLRVNANYDTVRPEAEILMARFRHDRACFEQGSEAQGQALQWNLCRTKPTRDGIFEYLQAAQDMANLQDQLLGDLKTSWREAVMRQPPRGRVEGEYRIDIHRDLEPGNLLASFLYRSPSLTIVVMPEQVLAPFYQHLKRRTAELQLTHTIRMVTCRHNQPVWMALQHLGLEDGWPEGDLPYVDETLNHLRQAQDALHEQLRDDTEKISQVAGQIQSQVDRLNSRYGISTLETLKGEVSRRPNVIPLAKFLAIGDATAIIRAEIEGKGVAREERRKVRDLRGALEPLQHRAREKAEAVWALSESVRTTAEAHKARLRAAPVLTIVRSGVQRTFQGQTVDFLLQDFTQRPPRAGHQLRLLAEFAQTLLDQLPDASGTQGETFWKNLGMELDVRKTVRGQQRLHQPVADLLERAVQLTGISPHQLPGLLLEMALRQDEMMPKESDHGRNRQYVPKSRGRRHPRCG